MDAKGRVLRDFLRPIDLSEKKLLRGDFASSVGGGVVWGTGSPDASVAVKSADDWDGLVPFDSSNALSFSRKLSASSIKLRITNTFSLSLGSATLECIVSSMSGRSSACAE